MNDLTFGYALCGSFCTFSKSLKQMRFLAEKGYHLLPVMSYNAAKTDTRFGKAADFVQELHDISGRDVIQTIVEAEPIGPKKMVDLMIVAPCTGNTLAKLANGITDTPVTMAVKSNLRIGRQNIGKLLNTKHVYFVPLAQDDPEKKPYSLVADFEKLLPAALAALEGRQLQPIFG